MRLAVWIKEIRTHDLLDQLGIPYERVDHEALATIACLRKWMKY